MTLYGIGLGPGATDLLTVRGRRRLESVDVVYSPGRLSRRVAAEYVPESKLGDLEFPMTTDPEELKAAWKTAAAEVAPRARDGDAAFVTLGDPCIYSTFGHLRRTLRDNHPGVDIEAGAELTLREAPRRGASRARSVDSVQSHRRGHNSREANDSRIRRHVRSAPVHGRRRAARHQ
jgi:precorrin-2/cobalt-factor-2 C20-methyltransferase